MKKEVGQKYRVIRDEYEDFGVGTIIELVEVDDHKVSYYKDRNGKVENMYDIDHELCEVELIEEEIDIEPDYRKLLMENEIKNFKLKVSSSYVNVYKKRLMSSLYQKEIIGFLDYMESLGYEEKELVPYFESKGE